MIDTLPNPRTLEANLRAIAARSPAAADAIRRAASRRDATFSIARDGALTGVVGLGNAQRRLASEFHPLKEAQRLADSVDVIAAAAVVVRGFGLGHHVAAFARRLTTNGTIVVFEPDVELLRAVLERVDCTAWLAACPVVFVTRADDKGELTGVLSGLEGVVSLGTRIIDHPPSRARLRDSAEVFGATLASVVSAVRTNVATTLVQVEVTLRNVLNNVGVYTAGAGITDLARSAAGVPAVLVAAGPSLKKNVELLKRPGVRDRVVIIAVQTVLKQLLAMGVKPHYVTALDYHEISARFYEGLTKQDVDGVTLVIEPKCNPAIPRSFPGEVRCVGDEVLDKVLGPGLTREMGSLPPGATVAHLSYALARHLGCDPVILIGQDLGFTNHQYYGAGAAIHQVWSSELSEFRTLEMLEWERIARMRGLLRRVSDQQGRPMYADEQMATYQVLFERAFQKDVAAGLTVIDATEGGTLKQHTRVMPLALALERFAPAAGAPTLGRVSEPSSGGPATRPPVQPRRVEQRMNDLAVSAIQVRDGCRATIDDLSQMLAHLEDQTRVNTLIDRVNERGRVLKHEVSYWIAQHLNQAGALNRFRADRAIALTPTLTGDEKQRRQIERDIRNIEFLRDAADQARSLLDQAAHVLRGEAPQTRDLTAPEDPAASRAERPTRSRVLAVIHVDERWSALGARRTRADAVSSLSPVLTRLAACKELDGVVIAAESKAIAESLARDARPAASITLIPAEIDIHALRARRRSTAAARLWSRHSWRGGIGGLTVFDECVCPAVDAPLATAHEADAMLALGDDWVMVDPSLTDAIIARYREAPAKNRFTFTQSPPGLCGCVLDAGLLTEMSTVRGSAFGGVRATVAGLLAYLPDAPRMDPIAKAPCVGIPHAVRDSLWRCTWDDRSFRDAWERTTHADPAAWNLPANQCIHALSLADADRIPEFATIDAASPCESVPSTVVRVRDLAQRQPLLGVTITDLDGSGEWRALADGCRSAGAAGLHLRTTHESLLRFGVETLTDAMDFGFDAVSIELPGDSRALWQARGGEDTRDRVWDMLQEFIDERNRRCTGGLPRTWLVPRLTRRDATLEEVEMFYDRWLTACGACVIDAPGPLRPWESIAALPLPTSVIARRAWDTLAIEAEVPEPTPQGAAV